MCVSICTPILSPLRTRVPLRLPLECMRRTYYTHKITDNLELVSNTPVKTVTKTLDDYPVPVLKIISKEKVPLCILLSWLGARRKAVHRCAELYLRHDFDVLTVSCTPTQVMWPRSGCQAIAQEILSFILNNPHYESKMIHGFSVSSVTWGLVMSLMKENPQKYSALISNEIIGQVWDSPADFKSLPIGFGIAVYPKNNLKNNIMRNLAAASVRMSLAVFQRSVTKYYHISTQNFSNPIVKCPALFFYSKNDKIAFYENVKRQAENWESQGIKVHQKVWDDSPHVGHLRTHYQEYSGELDKFLKTIHKSSLK